MRKPREGDSGARKRTDGRRQLLIYLSAEIIRELKYEALLQEMPAYELAEEAIAKYLKKRKRNRQE